MSGVDATTLIPSIGACTFDSGGERRFAERLEQKLEDDYLCWHNVALGPANAHPDFVVFHPRRGLLILEVKDWRRDTLFQIDKFSATIRTASGNKEVQNPLEQARRYAEAAADALQRDRLLVFASGREAGRLLFPWSYGVVFANLTRKAFDEGRLGEVIAPSRVICQDEMLESIDAEAFQQRLWQMFPIPFRSALSLPQIDRVRWHLFPEVRIAPRQAELFEDNEPPPDLMRVLDLQQEQLARSLDEGHDFKPEWLKLVVQMVDPKTNSLLVLYDDAQSIYGDERKKKFSFKHVGIQAQGRITILKVNYRNTDAILRFARDVARGILNPTEADDDGVPLIRPQSAGRAGPEPQIVNLPSLKDEAEFIAQRLKEAHRNGTPWRDMAVIYRDYHRDAKLIRKTLPAFGIPVVYFEDATYAADEDKVTIITMHSCKGLEFPLVVIPGADRIRATEELPPQEAKLLYVAMTRATRELVVSGAVISPVASPLDVVQ